MPAPLKNVTMKEVEAAIAKALADLNGTKITVNIGEMVFDESYGRVEVKLSAYEVLDYPPGMMPI